MFVSDHGDMLGEHRIFRKAMPYEGSVKIPFIISSFGNYDRIPCGEKINEKEDKYIYYPRLGIEQYFHKKNDPHEEHNLIHDPTYAKRIEYLRERLYSVH